jgi:hypothetical protein
MKQFFTLVFTMLITLGAFAQSFESTLLYEINTSGTEDSLKIYIRNNTSTAKWLGGVQWGVIVEPTTYDVSTAPSIANDVMDQALMGSLLGARQVSIGDYLNLDELGNPVTSVDVDGVTYTKAVRFTTSPLNPGTGTFFTVPADGQPHYLLTMVFPRLNPGEPVNMVLLASDDLAFSFLVNSLNEVGNPLVNNTDYDIQPMGSTFPVELLDFTAYQVGESTVQLDWITAQEINNQEFQIERSLDGRLFKQIGQLEGAGNSDTERAYTYKDFSVPQTTIYYRLRQIDYDGEYSLSEIRQVVLSADFAPQVDIFPNPTSEYVTVDAAVSPDRRFEVRMIDMAGRVVYMKRDVKLSGNKLTIDVSSFSPDNYILQILDREDELQHAEVVVVTD